MKKLLISIFVLTFSFNISFSQHFVPLKLSVSPDLFSMAGYGGFSVDKGNAADFMAGLSNTAQSGFIVNALYRNRGSITQSYSQFMIDINPIIVNWDPFTWNKLITHPIDSVFNVTKMPFTEDAMLHIGWQENILKRIRRTNIDQEYTLTKFFTEFYFAPYSINRLSDSIQTNYRFSNFNISTGAQFSYVKKDVPILGNFLIGLSAQFNFMLVNEQDANQHNFTSLTGYNEKLFWGPGGKLIVQTNYLNIYVEGRQYYGIQKGEKFSQDPIFLVGAFGNIHFLSHKGNTQNNNGNNNDGNGGWN